jgi:hypothetical protein
MRSVLGRRVRIVTSWEPSRRRYSTMEVFAAINCPTDEPFWISRETFLEKFDQDDFRNRNVLDVQPAYLETWFYETEDGRRMFYIPAVSAVGRRTDLVSSRHRTAVLLPHLTELPFALALGHLMGEPRAFLERLPKRPLDVSSSFWIPDLPIRRELP